MLKLLQGVSKWLANYTSIFIIGVAVFTFFFPHTFDWVRGTTQTVILGIIMLTMGLTLTTNDFKILAQHFGHNSRRNLLEMGPDASQETCLSPLSPIWFSTTFMVCHGSKTIVHMVFLQQKVANNFVCM